jgi:hypothetical protein
MSNIEGVFLKVATLKKWDRFPRFQDLRKSDFVMTGAERSIKHSVIPFFGRLILESNFKTAGAVHFISHKWDSPIHPDPDGKQLAQITVEFPDEALVWYDYSCLPQAPRTEQENELFLAALKGIPDLIRQSWFTVVGGDIETYTTRTWCQFEVVCATHYNSRPYIPQIQGEPRTSNEETTWCLDESPLQKVLSDCISALPKDTNMPSPYLGGFYIDVPDLNDKAFRQVKSVFFQLKASVKSDRKVLWELLRKLFPRRRDDYTYMKY